MTYLINIKRNVYVKNGFSEELRRTCRKKAACEMWMWVVVKNGWTVQQKNCSAPSSCRMFVSKVIHRSTMETSPWCIYWPQLGLSAMTLSWPMLPYIVISNDLNCDRTRRRLRKIFLFSSRVPAEAWLGSIKGVWMIDHISGSLSVEFTSF